MCHSVLYTCVSEPNEKVISHWLASTRVPLGTMCCIHVSCFMWLKVLYTCVIASCDWMCRMCRINVPLNVLCCIHVSLFHMNCVRTLSYQRSKHTTHVIWRTMLYICVIDMIARNVWVISMKESHRTDLPALEHLCIQHIEYTLSDTFIQHIQSHMYTTQWAKWTVLYV